MKTKLYYLLLLVLSITITSCSDDDDTPNVDPTPELKSIYVSRIKVSTPDNPNEEVKTIKLYYDSQKRVTGVHWGTTIPGRSAWKIIYKEGAIDIQMSGDRNNALRTCNIGADGTVKDMIYKDDVKTMNTVFGYDDKHLVTISSEEYLPSAVNLISSNYTWSLNNITNAITKVSQKQNDSLIIASNILYEDFSYNNLNIDFNRLLDSLCGMYADDTEVPLLLGLCANKSQNIITVHKQNITNVLHPEKDIERGYQVLSYSIQNGTLTTLEILITPGNIRKKLDIIYKANE